MNSRGIRPTGNVPASLRPGRQRFCRGRRRPRRNRCPRNERRRRESTIRPKEPRPADAGPPCPARAARRSVNELSGNLRPAGKTTSGGPSLGSGSTAVACLTAASMGNLGGTLALESAGCATGGLTGSVGNFAGAADFAIGSVCRELLSRRCHNPSAIMMASAVVLVAAAIRLRRRRRAARTAAMGRHSHDCSPSERAITVCPLRAGGPSKSSKSANDAGRAAGSRATQAASASASTSGVSGAKCRTSVICAACALLSFPRLFPPASAGRPASRCHHRQPQANRSLATPGGTPSETRSGADSRTLRPADR